MNNKALILILLVVAVGLIGFMVLSSGPSGKPSLDDNNIVATVYKSPTCGCCGVYASYMEKEGYEVQIENVQNMSTVKQQFEIPYELESCHTMEVGGYVVEGHIPEEAIQKLLAEKPDIKGIGMPGMPSGSPGMPGPKLEEFVIYEITHDGTKGDIFMVI